MIDALQIAKGIHPGIILERELKKRGLSKGQFALSVNEYPQIISAIISGRRNMNTPLAMRIENALGMEEGFLMTLQVFYDIRQEQKKQAMNYHPEFSQFRPALFWDTEMEQLDWKRQKRAIIKRVFERGSSREKQAIIKFYGEETVNEILDSEKAS